MSIVSVCGKYREKEDKDGEKEDKYFKLLYEKNLMY